MEKIKLHVVSRAGVAIVHSLSAVFGIAGGTIGRGGQNKLVLPDADAGVARVHAMVRLEADAAYIANLCERRSLRVDGMEVRSGQEARLHIGADVHIGPYCLRAVAQGAPANEVAASGVQTPSGAAHVPPVAFEPGGKVVNMLASEPNPWTDVPGQVHREGEGADSLVPHASTPKSGGELDDLLGLGGTSHSAEDVGNPFAMLGRVDSSLSPATSAGPERKARLAGEELAAYLAATTVFGGVALAPAATEESRNANLIPVEPAQAVKMHASARINVFDELAATPRAATAAVNRPLMIPEDFDPFARDFRKETEARDPWAGGLPEKSLAQVANLQSDELIRSLPQRGQLEHSLDNPAHSGLPKALDPKVETDPMRLFGVASVLDGLERGNAQPVRESDLVQVFNFPKKGAEIGLQEMGQSPCVAKNVTLSGSSPEVSSEAMSQTSPPAAQAFGLLPTQTLDVALFDATGISVPERVPALDLSVETMIHGDAGTDFGGHFVESAKVSQSPNATLDVNVEHVLPSRFADLTATAQGGLTVSPDARILTDAFLAGAGLARGRVEGVMTPELMHQFGEAFRVAVQGTIELLAARSETKREFRADVTIIASRANNPLKFLPNSDGVIMQMFGECFPGFMKPVPSMEEAYFDLKVHQLALMAGIRAAYVEALARFDPEQFEKRCETNSGMFRKISSIARKAALWDDYKKSYHAICTNAEDDLVGFSGEAFVKAYDAAADAARERP